MGDYGKCWFDTNLPNLKGYAMHPVDEMVAALDAKHGPKWDMYRTALGEFVVKLESRKLLSAETLSGAMQAAIDFTELPVIPRRPEVFHRSEYDTKKDGSKWVITHRRNEVCGNITSKKNAEAFIDNWNAIADQDCENWDNEYGPFISTHTEGVDFVYAE